MNNVLHKKVALAICKADNPGLAPCECTMKGDVCASMMDKAKAACREVSLYIARQSHPLLPDDCSDDELTAAVRAQIDG